MPHHHNFLGIVSTHSATADIYVFYLASLILSNAQNIKVQR
jgi:hypothetical protein